MIQISTSRNLPFSKNVANLPNWKENDISLMKLINMKLAKFPQIHCGNSGLV